MCISVIKEDLKVVKQKNINNRVYQDQSIFEDVSETELSKKLRKDAQVLNFQINLENLDSTV